MTKSNYLRINYARKLSHSPSVFKKKKTRKESLSNLRKLIPRKMDNELKLIEFIFISLEFIFI